jgi:hypothetical protein
VLCSPSEYGERRYSRDPQRLRQAKSAPHWNNAVIVRN